MNYSAKRKCMTFKIVELIILLLITGALCGFFMIKLSERFASLRANEVLININSMTKEAYSASKKLDETNAPVAKMDLNGCTIINKNNAWYMVCDLNDLTENKAEQENVLKKFQEIQKNSRGMMLSSAADFGKFETSGEQKYIVTFLRFSSAKKINHKFGESSANLSNSKPDLKIFMNL